MRINRKKFRTNYFRTQMGWRWQITGYYSFTLLRSGTTRTNDEARAAVKKARGELVGK